MQGDGRIYFGSNLDWRWENGLIIVNKRGVKKASLVQPGNQPAEWISRYGSVTFNQFGQEMPFGGMNEAGLVVEQMWLDSTRYPARDSRPAVNLLEWIQYQLDNCRTVEEVLATDSKIRLEAPPVSARVHYLVSDASGNCASIECLDGRLVCHCGKDLPFHALANNTYENSLAYARAHPDPGTENHPLWRTGSEHRFARATARVIRFEPSNPTNEVQYAFDTLNQVHQWATKWRIVYDVSAHQIHLRTHDNPRERTIDLQSLDFSCGHPAQFANIDAKPSADGQLEFQDLTMAAQQAYLHDFSTKPAVRRVFGDLSKQIGALMLLVQSYTCADK